MKVIVRKVLSTFFFLLLLPMLGFTEKITIPFYIPSNATTESSRIYHNILLDFEKDNPDIDVIFHPSNSYDEVLSIALELAEQNKSSGVIAIEISELLTLKDANAVISLENFLARENRGDYSFLDSIIPGFLANCYGDDGNLYGLPLMRSTPIVYYNMDILNPAFPQTPNDIAADKHLQAKLGLKAFFICLKQRYVFKYT